MPNAMDDLALRLAKPYDSFGGTGTVQAVTPVVPRPSGKPGAAIRMAEFRGEASYRSLNTPNMKGWAA